MTLEQKPTRDQMIQSDLAVQLAQTQLTLAELRADFAELQAVNADLEGQVADASDRA